MLEETSYRSKEYTNSLELNAKRRRALGIYYTPRSAAALLAKWAIRNSTDQILEPSFGGCTILEAAVNQLRELGCSEPSDQLFGFDVDEAAFGHLHRLLGKSGSSNFAQQDFLTVSPDRVIVDAVIANPPFVSYHRMDSTQREAIRTWRDRYLPSFAMTASLWAYFLTHSLSFLKADGRLAFVLPFAAYSSDYSQPILNMLQTRFQSLAVYRMREQLFIQAGADERTVILLAEGFRIEPSSQCSQIERSVDSIRELEIRLSRQNSRRAATEVAESPSVDSSVISLVDSAVSNGQIVHLGDVAVVRIGEVVGDTGYLVKSSAEWESLKIPERYLRPLLTRLRQSPGIRITRQDVFRPYTAIPLLLCAGRSQALGIRQYLDAYPAKLRESNHTFSKRHPWHAVSYDTTASAFIGSMSHESPRIVWNCANISCANGLYKLHLKKKGTWNSLLAAASATTVFKLSAEMQARVRGSGALKLEPSDVSKLLIPSKPLRLSSPAVRKFMRQIDLLIRNREYKSATRLADRVFYLDTGVFLARDLSRLQDQFHELRRQRLPKVRFG